MSQDLQPDRPQFSEQRKLLNDHDLRLLFEQAVVLRHQETLSVAVSALAATTLTLLMNSISLPHRSSFSDAREYASALAMSFFPIVPIIIPIFCLFIAKICSALERNELIAREIIVTGYQVMLTRNDLDDPVLIKLYDARPTSRHLRLLPRSAKRVWMAVAVVAYAAWLVVEYGLPYLLKEK